MSEVVKADLSQSRLFEIRQRVTILDVVHSGQEGPSSGALLLEADRRYQAARDR